MRTHLLVPSLAALASVVALGCTPPDAPIVPADDLAAAPLFRASGQPGGGIWSDGELYRVEVPGARFDPANGPFDELYRGGNGFLDGVIAISDAHPGSTNYNGGRWHVNFLRPGVDPNKYANASSVADLDPADFMSTDVYFSCPLIPNHGTGMH